MAACSKLQLAVRFVGGRLTGLWNFIRKRVPTVGRNKNSMWRRFDTLQNSLLNDNASFRDQAGCYGADVPLQQIR